MHRLKSYLATALVAGFGAMTTGCTDAETSIYVQRVIIPEVSNTGCTWQADPSGLGLIQGRLDIGYPGVSSYRAVLGVGNQLVPRGDPDTLRTESNRVQFYELEVEVFNFAGALLSTFTTPATGFADPGAGDQPGFGAVHGVLVDSAAIEAFTGGGEAIGQVIISRVIVKGITVGGTEVETAPWDFPIEVRQSAGLCVDVDCTTSTEACADDIEAGYCFLGNDMGSAPDCRAIEIETGADASCCAI